MTETGQSNILCPICLSKMTYSVDINVRDGATYFNCIAVNSHRFYRSPWEFECIVDATGVFEGVRKFIISGSTFKI